MKRREFITLLGGAAAAWPLTVRAQRSRPVRIGILSTAGTPTNLLFETFRQELRRLGYVEGSGIVIERLRRFRNRAQLRYGNEGTQAPQVHRSNLCPLGI